MGIGTEEVTTQVFKARNWEDGDEIRLVRDRSNSLPSSHFHQRGEAAITEEKLAFYEPKKVGTSLEYGGRFFKVVKAKFDHLEKRWGDSSVFVVQISEDEYRKLQSEKSAV